MNKKETLKEVAERLKDKELFKESNDRARKVLSEIKSLPIVETIQEAAETVEEYFLSNIKNMLQFNNDALAIRFMEKYYHAKKEQERSYSEEDLRTSFGVGMKFMIDNKLSFEEWFEQFKKK